MSNAVYPSFPGIRPVVSRIPVAPPVQVRTTPSQREFRARDATLPRYRYSVSYEVLRSSAAYPELQALVGFFNARGGRFDSFLFDDDADNATVDQAFGVGDGSTTAWQAVRAFGGFVEPVDAFKGTPLIMADGAPCTNLITDGSFNTDTDSDGTADDWPTYDAGTTGTITRSQVAGDNSPSATRVAAAGLGSTSSDRAGAFNSNYFAASVGSPISVGASLRDSNNVTQVLAVVWYDATQTFLSNSTATFAAVGGTWTRRTATFTAPASAAFGRVRCYVQSATGGPAAAWIEVDRVKVEAAAASTTYSSLLATVADGSGIVSFREAPRSGNVLTWSGGFYRRCRFERDELDVERFLWELWEGRRVELRSTREA